MLYPREGPLAICGLEEAQRWILSHGSERLFALCPTGIRRTGGPINYVTGVAPKFFSAVHKNRYWRRLHFRKPLDHRSTPILLQALQPLWCGVSNRRDAIFRSTEDSPSRIPFNCAPAHCEGRTAHSGGPSLRYPNYPNLSASQTILRDASVEEASAPRRPRGIVGVVDFLVDAPG